SLSYLRRRPPGSPLFPYTTLFRSLQGAAGEGAVPHVGNGDLDGVLVHRRFRSEDVGGHGDVLGEVLGHASADHEKTCGWVLILQDRKSTRLNSSHVKISYAVFCLK